MDAMIINPDLESRMRLKEAMSFVPDFGVVRVISTLTEAMQRLFGGESFGSFFISTLFGHDFAREFIRKSKETEGGRDAAYIFTFSGEAKSTELANDLVHGADGFLIEPFSVESLEKIVKLAVQVRSQRVAAREKRVIRLLLQEAVEGIDECVWDAYGEKDIHVPAHMEKIRRGIHGLSEASQGVYFEVLEEVFSEIERPRVIGYRGPSRRLRKTFGAVRRDKEVRSTWRILRKS